MKIAIDNLTFYQRYEDATIVEIPVWQVAYLLGKIPNPKDLPIEAMLLYLLGHPIFSPEGTFWAELSPTFQVKANEHFRELPVS